MEGLLEPVIQESYWAGRSAQHLPESRDRERWRAATCSMGIMKRDAQVRVVRDGTIIYTSKLNSLKRFKDDANEVRAGFECGLGSPISTT